MTYYKTVMAVLDTAILERTLEITGSSPVMMYYKPVMAGRDPAGISFPPPCGEGCLSEAKTGWGLREGCTPPLAPPHKGYGIHGFVP